MMVASIRCFLHHLSLPYKLFELLRMSDIIIWVTAVLKSLSLFGEEAYPF